MQNQELADLSLALGVQPGKKFDLEGLRYGRVIIMTDADVDGAHIAALLMTYFYQQMPGLIESAGCFWRSRRSIVWPRAVILPMPSMKRIKTADR